MSYRAMVQQAIDQRQASEVILRLVDLAEKHDQAQREFIESLIKARQAFPDIVKDLSAGGRYKYADLAQIAEKIDPHLEKNGLTYRFDISSGDGKCSVRCILMHKNGYEQAGDWLEADADTSGNKAPIQALGSSLTYLERYALVGSLGLAVSRDDDGASTGKAITETQVKELEAIAGKKDIAPWLKKHDLEGLGDITKAAFPRAKSSLMAFVKPKETAQ